MKKKNRVLRGIGTTMLAGSIALGGFTGAGLQQPFQIEASAYQQVDLKQGMRHQDVVQLKKDLATAGFKVPGKGTNLYGKQTEKQVKAFQKKYKLTQNGIADSVTLQKLASVANPVLENGIRHQNVVQLKKDLAKAGFKVPGKGTTLFGKQTEKQVKAFQKYYGVSQSGKIDNKTDKEIKAVVNSPLQNGKRHKDTVQLKNNLAAAGFKVPGNGTNLYGKQTEKQVKAFQKKHKLVQNGIADSVTLNKLAQAANPILENGVRHEDVKQLKKDLAKAGFKVPGKGTTLFGKDTEKQVKAFQKYYGLSQSGKIDNKTDKQIKAVINSPLQNGKRHKDTIQLKKNLAIAGYKVSGNGTNLYGKQTEKQVKAFQKKYKLVQNGIADKVTLAKLKEVVKNTEQVSTVIKKETDIKTIPFDTIYKDDPSMLEGEQKVQSKGIKGEEVVRYEVTYVNGKETNRKELSAEVTKQPKDEIILRGTKIVEVKYDTYEEDIDFTYDNQYDDTLDRGYREKIKEGKKGRGRVTYEVTFVNGKETDREFFDSEILVPWENGIFRVGTKEPDPTEFSRKVISLVNEERAKVGVAPLKEDAKLMELAQKHSEYMDEIKDLNHSDDYYLENNGVVHSMAGENIGRGPHVPEGIVKTWMESSFHKSNILNPNFTHMGAGFSDDTIYNPYWTQIFIKK